ncbi:hypothetical protein M0R45_034581 [Rubus argutus]|uniref:Uncharacterized protein n=1 Tax=Rubus argutus TaxID=59490 RepID=A0AAW1VS86_RUBAR
MVSSEGAPLSWWSSKFFKLIGDICGGLIEVDKRTANLKSLYEARIKVRENVSGFLPEWVKLSEGEQSYIVHIQPLSPAIQSLNIRKREQQFQSFCEKRFSGATEWSSCGFADDRNQGRSSAVGCPVNSNLAGIDSLMPDVTIGNLKILKRVKAATFSSKTGKSPDIPTSSMSEDLNIDKEQVERLGTENKLLNNVLDAPLDGGGQVDCLGMEENLFNGRPADLGKGGTRSLMERNICLEEENSSSRVNKLFFGPWPTTSMTQSKEMEVGSKTTFGSDKGKLPKRHSASDLLDDREVALKLPPTTRFSQQIWAKFGIKTEPNSLHRNKITNTQLWGKNFDEKEISVEKRR